MIILFLLFGLNVYADDVLIEKWVVEAPTVKDLADTRPEAEEKKNEMLAANVKDPAIRNVKIPKFLFISRP